MPNLTLDDGSRDPLMRLDPHSLILSGEDSLQLINRRGAFDLRAKNLQHLHRIFAPHLDGSRRESELLAAVGPDQVSAVRSYLGTLRRSGAFVDAEITAEERPIEERPLEALGSSCPAGVFRVGPVSVSICLDASHSDSHTSVPNNDLAFLTPEEGLRRLIELRRVEPHVAAEQPGQTLIVVPESLTPGSEELERRAHIARWLLSGAADPKEGFGRLQIFRLSASAFSIERLAVIDLTLGNGEAGRVDHDGSGRVGIATLPDQLRLVDDSDREQLPLAVAKARLPFGPSTGPWFFGLDFEDVREAVAVDCLSGLAHRRRRNKPFFIGRLGDSTARFQTTDIGRFGGPSMLHRSSRRLLSVALLEQRESDRPESDRHYVDLLQLPGDERTRCVQKLLSLHYKKLPAYQAFSPARATTFTSVSGLRSCSFFPRRALLEILLKVLYQTHYGPSSGPQLAIAAVPYRAGNFEMNRLIARFQDIEIALRVDSIWGRTLWSGRLIDRGGPS